VLWCILEVSENEFIIEFEDKRSCIKIKANIVGEEIERSASERIPLLSFDSSSFQQ